MKYLIMIFLPVLFLFGCSNSQLETEQQNSPNYESIPDTVEDLSSIKEDATEDVVKIITEGEYTVNDIELVADYYLSAMYWANYYLYKDFDVIEKQLLAQEDISIEIMELIGSYSSLAGRLRGGKARNGLPVLDEERRKFEEEIYALENLVLPAVDSPEQLINSPEWEALKIKHHLAYLSFDQLEIQIREFLLEVAPSQESTIQKNLDRMIEDNSIRDSMEDYL